jgi:hypothetical protein
MVGVSIRRSGDERIAMNDDEMKRAAARESAAFMRGFAYGCEQTINAHDGLLPILVLLIERERVNGAERLADADHKRVLDVLTEVRRVRDCGAVQSLSMFEVEQAMAVER